VSGQINIAAPSTLVVVAGAPTLSSLGVIPQDGVVVIDPDAGGTVTVEIIAGNGGAALTASSLSGATVSASANTLWVTGLVGQVNTALASLEVTEPGTATSDVLTMYASDPGALPGQTAMDVRVVPQTGPVFVAPPHIVTVTPGTEARLPSLVFTDSLASGLALMGLGAEETLSLTLSVTEGVLMFPGYSALSGVVASGLGSGTVELSFTADEIGTVNTLLSDLVFSGPSLTLGENMSFSLWDYSGVLARSVTEGNIFLATQGHTGPSGTFVTAGQTLILGDTSLTGTLAVTGDLALQGNLLGTGAVDIAPGAALILPQNSLFLSGTSLDDGALTAYSLIESGTLVAANLASFNGEVALGTAALLEFTGSLVADGAEALNYDLALSLAPGAVVSGGGTLTAGNFSESGLIYGTGTILAQSGETLEIDAGSISGGADLAVDGGGVMVLGPVAPLYGIFDATPLTIDSSVTLSFLAPGGEAVAGGYAGTLGGAGGAFVINGPQVFSATISGFAPGDELIFPDLSDVGVYNATANSFSIGGIDAAGAQVTYVVCATVAAGLSPMAGLDAEGDSTVYLHSASATLSQAAALAATSGVAQRLPGLSLIMPGSTTQALKLTISSMHGLESAPGVVAAKTITLSAANIGALNSDLAALSYTGAGLTDSLTFTSNLGLLAGFSAYAFINTAGKGEVNAYGGEAYSEAEWVQYSTTATLPVITAPAVMGAVQVQGETEFDGVLQAVGLSGTALLVDEGAQAIFAAAATVALGSDITLGDAAGGGTLDLLTDGFSTSGNVTLESGGLAEIAGTLTAAGALRLSAGALAAVQGALTVASASLGTGGELFGFGGGQMTLGGVSNAGTLLLESGASASAASYAGSGSVVLGGGTSLSVTGNFAAAAGAVVSLGVDAALRAATITQTGGSFADAGLVSASGAIALTGGLVTLQGGTLEAETLTLTGTIAGYGVVAAPSASVAGTLVAQGGRLLLAGDVTDTSALTLTSGATLELAGGLAGGPVLFTGGAALVTVDDVALGFTGVENMIATDAVDLAGVTPNLVSYSSGAVHVVNSLGGSVALFGLLEAGSQPAVTITSDGAGGALITLGDELPCFARGTGILTPQGYVAVERLKPGDPVITASGARRPVRWLGWRTLDLGPAATRFARPVLVLPGAFGPGRPAKALRLSPLHGVYVGGVIVPVTHLVNGATIIRETGSTATTYYHVELDRHDILLAEGLACESYFCAGNRAQFAQGIGRPSGATREYAPRVTAGARLVAARRGLHAVALAAGYSPSYWPSVRAVAAGQGAVPEISAQGGQRLARFAFPDVVQEVTLLSATACPADTDPVSEDRRELGVCLGEARGVRLGEGWLPRGAGDAGLWMGARAELVLARPAREFTLPLVAIAPSWRRNTVDARRVRA
jgi:hypothetical protein